MASIENKEVYFAGPLFNVAQKDFNLRLTQRIESELGLTVFLPQRDGLELVKLQGTPDEKNKAIFWLDHDKVVASDVFLFVLDGRTQDEGGCVELGIAFEHRLLTGKKQIIVGILTDVRSEFPGQQLNPMVDYPFDYITHTEDELIECVRKRIDTPVNTSVSH